MKRVFLSLLFVITSCTYNVQVELSKIKIIKHDEININKKFSITENKDEIENLKKEFNCSSVTNPPDYFGGFEPNKHLFLCYSNELLSMSPYGQVQYIYKDSDGKFKKESTLQKIFSPVNTDEEALSFALSEKNGFIINNSKDEKDFINKGFVSKIGGLGPIDYILKINQFQFGKGFKVFVNQIDETFVKKDDDGSYILNLFHFQPNINKDSCKPELWEVINKISEEGKVLELSRTKIVEDDKIEDCVLESYQY